MDSFEHERAHLPRPHVIIDTGPMDRGQYISWAVRASMYIQKANFYLIGPLSGPAGNLYRELSDLINHPKLPEVYR